MKKIIKRISTIIISILLLFNNIDNVHAASATISVSSSTNRVLVGNTFNVTIKISSGSSLGSWEFTPSYNSRMFKLISGETPVVEAAENDKTNYKTYTYKFKAISTGTGTISIKASGAYSWSKQRLSISTRSKSISVITKAQLEASYSKNNNLKSLSVDGLKLTPDFSKDTLEYHADADSNTEEINIQGIVEDNNSSLIGTGIQKVSEGENKFNITVTAQNGSTKTYVLIVNVNDPNPINVNVNNEKYTVVKRESLLSPPTNFIKKEIIINEQKVPAFYNEINNFTIVGLKDTNSKIEYFIYNETDNTYQKYYEANLNEMKLFPLKMNKNFDITYKKTKTIINDIEFESLKKQGSDYSIIHAKNLLTGKDDYYTYDSKTNTAIRYTDEMLTPLAAKINNYENLIIILGIETIIIILILVFILISKCSKKKQQKKKFDEKKIEEDLKKQKQQIKMKENKKNEKKENIKKH